MEQIPEPFSYKEKEYQYSRKWLNLYIFCNTIILLGALLGASIAVKRLLKVETNMLLFLSNIWLLLYFESLIMLCAYYIT